MIVQVEILKTGLVVWLDVSAEFSWSLHNAKLWKDESAGPSFMRGARRR